MGRWLGGWVRKGREHDCSGEAWGVFLRAGGASCCLSCAQHGAALATLAHRCSVQHQQQHERETAPGLDRGSQRASLVVSRAALPPPASSNTPKAAHAKAAYGKGCMSSAHVCSAYIYVKCAASAGRAHLDVAHVIHCEGAGVVVFVTVSQVQHHADHTRLRQHERWWRRRWRWAHWAGGGERGGGGCKLLAPRASEQLRARAPPLLMLPAAAPPASTPRGPPPH